MAAVLKYRVLSHASRHHSLRCVPTFRSFSVISNRNNKPKPFATGPSPPRLSKEEQEIFEQLQQNSTGAFSTPRSTPKVNQSPDAKPTETNSQTSGTSNAEFKASGNGEELHPDMRRGAQPEFEGEQNPRTGEVGGPKNNPLRWGAAGDWSYNGRVTDF